MRVKEETGKVGLKLNIQKTKIMASGPWQIDGGKKTPRVTDFIFLGSKITAVTAAMKLRRLLLGKPRQHIKRQRHQLCRQRKGLNLAKRF